ncbi:helix-turn-helix domain-containing protein [Paenibacillus eucommiae]|uniref:AraC-like DNA-binding protein n=1 Tax=Paenibacillus eucommiae TaxID=1355755 RepID=A0ABS4J9T1_9BACL|nr:helix-turn-helix domain-containing protein [Paenibacillus eucommiae]MBP1996607.1 AraC-like DNA-binding protein [Paenibacillus eucommiae]
MIRNKMRLPIYMQYLISYAIVLFIPTFITGVVIYKSILDTVREQSLAANEQMLKQVGEVIDTKFLEMANIATDLSTNPLVSLSQYRNYFYFYSMRHAMNYRLSNTFLHEVFLYDREREYLYSSVSTYSLEVFNDVYKYQDWPVDDIRDTLNTSIKPVLRKAELINGESFITYLRPIPVSAYKPNGTAIYLIREQVFRDLLEPVLLYKGNEAFIIDKEGEIITGSYEGEPLEESIIAKLLSTDHKKQVIHKNHLGQSVNISYVQSKLTGFIYAVATPEKELFKSVNEIKYIALLSFMFIILLGSFGIYISMRFNYSPVRRIIASVEEIWGEIRDENGFKKIENALSTAEKWKQQNVLNAPYVRQHLLLCLLQGRITNKEEFNKAGSFVGLAMSQKSYFVAVIQAEGMLQTGMNDHILYRELELKGYQVFELQTEAELTLIIGQNTNSLPKDELVSVQQALTEELNQVVTIGVGTAYSELSQLTNSYIEASTALHHKFIFGSGKVICFSELDPRFSRKSYDVTESTEHLLVHLDRGSVDQAMKTVGILVDEIKGKSDSLFQAKSNCIEVINAILLFLRQRYSHINYSNSHMFPDVISYANFNSIDRLLEETVDVCRMACEIIQSGGIHLDRISGTDRIKAYIQEHFDDYNLNIQSMAADLGFSVSYISRIFKEDTGNTIMDHVKELRITKAKELLKTTELPVQEIVELIGYKDVSNFIRKFKQKLQMTPVEYRNYYKANKNQSEGF